MFDRQTLKLTEVTASDKLESFRAVKKVLKDHIALGNAQFPNGTNGHGIGSYLNVHEGKCVLLLSSIITGYQIDLCYSGGAPYALNAVTKVWHYTNCGASWCSRF
ncbi:uncharacterized protein LOC125421980 isoform X2 [Ziziphus jujuba]|uniref:Uncharacterized protein LOC125421980 isoform X2 n=1 Tax=Ziziphus jujuba TaxID=326968 RepID=A0ABM3ZYU2_ZIZJJ|nr:uncharacterized protein LOC125421980 isoform X2 [Ziziphus jujuba]